MEEEYKNTYKFLKGFISNKGKTTFSKLTIEEYNQLAKEHDLLSTVSIEFMTGLNWRNYKNTILKETV